MDIEENTAEEYRTKEAHDWLMSKPTDQTEEELNVEESLMEKTMGEDYKKFFNV